MNSQTFQKLCARMHTARTRELGFCIQVKDLYRKENLEDIAPLLVRSPERMKIELIIECLSAFSHMIYTKIIKKHPVKDQNLDPYQFNKADLIVMLMSNIDNRDWVDVAAIAMMLHQRDELQKGMLKINKELSKGEFIKNE